MSGVLNDELIYEILSAVEEIPEGKVASYGQIARLIGREKNSRLVGKVLIKLGISALGNFFSYKPGLSNLSGSCY